jgi:hypothetical protein
MLPLADKAASADAPTASAHSTNKVRVMVAALPPAKFELKRAGPPLARIAVNIAKLPELANKKGRFSAALRYSPCSDWIKRPLAPSASCASRDTKDSGTMADYVGRSLKRF